MTTTLDMPRELDRSDVEAITCQWEYYPPYRSGQPVEGCDDNAIPGTNFCARHLPNEDR